MEGPNMNRRFASVVSVFVMLIGLTNATLALETQYPPQKIDAAIDSAIAEKRLVG
jgi:hypothetical protein